MGPLLLLKVSVLLSVTLMAARLLYRAPAASRHALWSLSFAALLLLPPLAAALPAFYVPIPTGWDTTPLRIAPAIEQHSAVASPDQPTRPTGTPDIADAQDIQHVSASAADRAADWPAVNTLFFAGWLIGVAAAAVAVFVSLFKVHRLTRTAEVVQDPAWHRAAASVSAALGVHVPVRLLLSGRVSTPMVGGFRNPSIFLPPSASSWSLEHRILVLAHEIAHVAAHDPLRHLITRVALACYWFHPLAWIAAREAAIAREQACDETVLALGARPSAYARVLLDLAESMSARPPVRFLGALPMVHRSNLETRGSPHNPSADRGPRKWRGPSHIGSRSRATPPHDCLGSRSRALYRGARRPLRRNIREAVRGPVRHTACRNACDARPPKHRRSLRGRSACG